MATDYRTHHADCYLTHHECAIAEIERLRRSIAALEEAAGRDPGPVPTATIVRCTSAITVELVQQVGSDATIAAAARVSTLGQRSGPVDADGSPAEVGRQDRCNGWTCDERPTALRGR